MAIMCLAGVSAACHRSSSGWYRVRSPVQARPRRAAAGTEAALGVLRLCGVGLRPDVLDQVEQLRLDVRRQVAAVGCLAEREGALFLRAAGLGTLSVHAE